MTKFNAWRAGNKYSEYGLEPNESAVFIGNIRNVVIDPEYQSKLNIKKVFDVRYVCGE